MHWLIDYIWKVGITIGPVLGYVYQYRLIEKNKSVGTFSIKLCGMLLFCNILRIGFYFSNHYALALLIQSFLMIAVQLFLLKLCVNTMVSEGTLKCNDDAYDEEGFDLFHNFWSWDTINRYFYTVGMFAVAVLFISYTFNSLGIQFVGEIIGYLSLVSESMLMLPQVIQNCKQKRVKGLSHLLVALNNIGDLMKFAFFIVNDQPMQFIVCGILQIFIDAFVIVQIIYYRNAKTEEQQTPSQQMKVQVDEKIDGLPNMQPQQINKPAQDYKQFQDQS